MQLKRSLLVDRVEKKEDRVLVYITEVRQIWWDSRPPVVLRVMTSVFSPTAAEGHSNPPLFRPDPGGPSAEPETSYGQDLRLLPAR